MLEELCDLVRNTSLCGLGQSAPNPVVSTLRYFARRVQSPRRAENLSRRRLQDTKGRRAVMSPGTEHQDAEDRRQGRQRAPG